MKRLAAALLVLAVASCASGPVHSPRLLSSRGPEVGDQRLVVEFVDRATDAHLHLDRVAATLRDRHGSPLAEAEGTQVWVGERSAHVFHFDLPEPGTYQLTFVAGGASFSGPVGLEAVVASPVVSVGEPAPRSTTATIDDAPLSRVTSDPDPDPSLYQLTVAEAVASEVAVIVFASPRHCLARSCGAVLGVVKEVATGHPGVAFVHVETVQLPAGSPPRHVPAVAEWGLIVEPSVFVTRDGVVSAYFEAVLSADELHAALRPEP